MKVVSRDNGVCCHPNVTWITATCSKH